MDADALRVRYLFSDQATKDRMIVETMLQVQMLEQRIEIMESRKVVPQEMEKMAKMHKIIS